MASESKPTHWIKAELIIAVDGREWAEDYGMTDPMAVDAIRYDVGVHLGRVFVGTAFADYATIDRITVEMGELPPTR